MASWFTGWSPIKSFPEYHGAYDVGTVDVEIPASDLTSPADAPEDAQPTVAFRIFYPCVKPSGAHEIDRPVRWIPQPQRETISAFAKFLGARDRLAGLISYLPQQLYYISLPAHRNAKLLDPPTSNGRWPVTFFSHGLAGSRNAYSQICGDMASSGVVVIALDHRDGSSPIQYVRATSTTEAHIVQPVKIPHFPVTDEIYASRDKQLRIRVWEIAMAFEAMMKIDAGHEVENLDSNTSRLRKERVEVLLQFSDMLDVHRPGKVTWSGHSFGAATTVQLLKSIYYHKDRTPADGKALITPKPDAAIIAQIMPESPTVLLDMWGLPLQSPQQSFLWDRPLPTYTMGGPNGSNVLSILSEAFKNWDDNLNINKHIVVEPALSRRPSVAPRLTREKGQLLPQWARLRAPSPSADSGYASEGSRSTGNLRRHASRGSNITTPSANDSTLFSGVAAQRYSSPLGTSQSPSPSPSNRRRQGPHMFFPQMSQHFSQSDFGVLFPWIANRITKAEEPERILELNFRAIAQLARESGIEVAPASKEYSVDGNDPEILDTEAGIRRWVPISIDSDDDTLGQEQADGVRPAMMRKWSTTSIESSRSKSSMTMGQRMEAQLEMGA